MSVKQQFSCEKHEIFFFCSKHITPIINIYFKFISFNGPYFLYNLLHEHTLILVLQSWLSIKYVFGNKKHHDYNARNDFQLAFKMNQVSICENTSCYSTRMFIDFIVVKT